MIKYEQTTSIHSMNCNMIKVSARGNIIQLQKENPIFQMSKFLETSLRWTVSDNPIFINVDPVYFHFLVSYAECRVASMIDSSVKNMLQKFVEKYIEDVNIQWAVYQLDIDMGIDNIDSPSGEWTLNVVLSGAIFQREINMKAPWEFTQAVVIISAILKEHFFPDIVLDIKQGINDVRNQALVMNGREFIPSSITISTADNSISKIIRLGVQEHGSYQMQIEHFSNYDSDRIKASLCEIKTNTPELRPFIEKLFIYLARYQNPEMRIF